MRWMTCFSRKGDEGCVRIENKRSSHSFIYSIHIKGVKERPYAKSCRGRWRIWRIVAGTCVEKRASEDYLGGSAQSPFVSAFALPGRHRGPEPLGYRDSDP